MFFFFKQKTAYEMRISDWSSDVCSSDLDVALITYKFGSKLGLWKAVVERVGVVKMEQLRAALSARPDREDRPLVASMEALVDIYLANDTVPRLLLRDASHDPERAGWVFDHVSRPLLDHFLPLIRRAHAAGRGSAPIPEMFFLSFAHGAAFKSVRRALLPRFPRA